MNRFLGMGVSFLLGLSWPDGLGVVRHHTNGIWLRERMYVPSLSHVQLFVTPWTVVHQAPLSMGFYRQEYWSGLPFPSPAVLDPGTETRSPALLADSLPCEQPGKPKKEGKTRLSPSTIPIKNVMGKKFLKSFPWQNFPFLLCRPLLKSLVTFVSFLI